MAWRDFRGFLAEAEKRGYVKVIEGADCDLEIGTLTELMSESKGPMLLFDRINGYPNGYRIMVVMDDDIDPSNAEEVLWAIATRTDPETTFEIQRDCPSSPLDPMIPPEQKRRLDYRSSRALILACRPWDWMDQFPTVNRASDELRGQVYSKWRSLFE